MDFIAIIKESSNLGSVQLSKLHTTFSMILLTKAKFTEALKLASSNLSSMDSKDSSVNATLNQYSQSLLFNSNAFSAQLNKVEVEVVEALQVFKENYDSVSKNVYQSVSEIIITIEKSKIRNEKLWKTIQSLICEMDDLFVKFQDNQQHCSAEHEMKFEVDLKSLEGLEKTYQLAIVCVYIAIL